jgi:two-component system, response regulator YesN
MFKVLLVDDEVFVRKGLQELIPWGELGYVIAGEADNGEEALVVCESLKPDLIITDIRMPVQDGLDLIRNAKEQGMDPVFIIVSGFHDFKYAQQALRYGVHDYILKPIDEEELAVTLKKLAAKITLKRLTALAPGRPAADSILEKLVEGHIQEKDAEEYAAALGMEALSSFAYIIAEVHYQPESPAIGLKEMKEAISQWDKSGAEWPVLEQRGGQYGILALPDRLAGCAGSLFAALQSLRLFMSRHLKRAVSLYAGMTVHSLTHIRSSYLSANDTAKHKFAEDGEGVILHERIDGKPLYMLDMDQDLYSRLMLQLEENDMGAAVRTIDSIFQLFHAQRYSTGAVLNSLTRCIIGMVRVMKEMDGNEGTVPSMKDMTDWENRSWSLQGLKEQFIQVMTEASSEIARLRKEQTKGGIEKIKKYIESHYNENISLKSISSKFFMNPVYLGQLFRKSYGLYFNDYLLGLRVQEAKKLLRQTDLRMYEVAERVGFQNADYFVTQFEKLEHMSPTEYRNKLIGKK